MRVPWLTKVWVTIDIAKAREVSPDEYLGQRVMMRCPIDSKKEAPQVSYLDSASAQFQKTFAVAVAAFLITACAAGAQQQGTDALHKLAFLKGTWACTIKGGPGNGFVQDVKYSFSPDGLWMAEVSLNSAPHEDDFATQMWGYDARTGKLVAYNFAANGVYTKSVEGWVDGKFISRRDDNGATVSLKPIDSHTMQWIISSADGTYVVSEDCVRK